MDKTIVTKHVGPLKNFSQKEVKKIKGRIEKNKSENETKRKGDTEKTIHREGKEYQPLTPRDETIEQVYKIINEANVFQSRNGVYQKHLEEYPAQKENEELKKNVGFALTILERKGQIKKIGNGKKGTPTNTVIIHFLTIDVNPQNDSIFSPIATNFLRS